MWEKTISRFTRKGQNWLLSGSNFQECITCKQPSGTLWKVYVQCLLLLPTGMLLAPSTLRLPTPSMIALSLSALPMYLLLLPLVLTLHPQPCPCHLRDPGPPSNEMQLLALTISLLFLSKPPNPSSLILYLTSSILASPHPPSPVPGSTAQSTLSTRVVARPISPTASRSPSFLPAVTLWRGM